MTALGSKGGHSNPSDENKAPWMRERIATVLDWSEVSIGIKDIVWNWASLAAQQVGVPTPIERPSELLSTNKRVSKSRNAE